MVREKVIPAIRQKLSWATKIKLQFDNAPGHLTKGKTDKDTGEIIFEQGIHSGALPGTLVRGRQKPPAA